MNQEITKYVRHYKSVFSKSVKAAKRCGNNKLISETEKKVKSTWVKNYEGQQKRPDDPMEIETGGKMVSAQKMYHLRLIVFLSMFQKVKIYS